MLCRAKHQASLQNLDDGPVNRDADATEQHVSSQSALGCVMLAEHVDTLKCSSLQPAHGKRVTSASQRMDCTSHLQRSPSATGSFTNAVTYAVMCDLPRIIYLGS